LVGIFVRSRNPASRCRQRNEPGAADERRIVGLWRKFCDLDLAGWQGNEVLAGFGRNVLDLTAVAIAVESDDDDGGYGGGERVEQTVLLTGRNSASWRS
jgi:hypothetical protein